jgi:Sulfotransferase domain
MKSGFSRNDLIHAQRTGGGVDAVLVCVRIPKSGSESLVELVRTAFADRRVFYLPDTQDADGQLSAFQRLRFLRSRWRNLLSHYRAFDMRDAYDIIEQQARTGDVIAGGHIDFASARANIGLPLKMITLFRDPVHRSFSEYNYARQVYLKRNVSRRFTAALMPKVAGTRDFDGFLDFMDEHKSVYGNLASRYIGWNGGDDLGAYFAHNVFHAGILEERERFARGLSDKLRKPLAFPHENQTERKSETTITASQRTKIERIYAHDMTLYVWARKNL